MVDTQGANYVMMKTDWSNGGCKPRNARGCLEAAELRRGGEEFCPIGFIGSMSVAP